MESSREAINRQENEMREMIRVRKPPPSQDHIISIKPSEDIITAVDREENELHRLSFKIAGKNAYCMTPRLFQLGTYRKKLGEMLISLAKYAGELENPDDMMEFAKDPTSEKIAMKLFATAIWATDIVQDLCLEIFFMYLDGHIEGVELSDLLRQRWMEDREWELKQAEHSIEWVKKNARADDLLRIYAACMAPDDMLKKKALHYLKTLFHHQNSQDQSSNNTSAVKVDSTPKTGTPTQSSFFEL